MDGEEDAGQMEALQLVSERRWRVSVSKNNCTTQSALLRERAGKQTRIHQFFVALTIHTRAM